MRSPASRFWALFLTLIPVVFGGCVSPLALNSIAKGESTSLLERSAWIEIFSPHFKILSTMSSSEAQELAPELERFHALIYLTNSPRGVVLRQK